MMEHIWAPWRIEYIQLAQTEGCFLCATPQDDKDTDNRLLHRGKHNFVILNSFPYNPGHLLVAPYRHAASLEELSDDEFQEHFHMVRRATVLLKETFNPNGFNVGINISAIAGAGLADHIHTHIVPRWRGDTNFMPVIANVKVVPQALAETYERLKGKF